MRIYALILLTIPLAEISVGTPSGGSLSITWEEQLNTTNKDYRWLIDSCLRLFGNIKQNNGAEDLGCDAFTL
jgi:hypothetical protein